LKKINASIEVLSGEEILLLHRSTLEILESVGAHLPNRRILEKLEKRGVSVNHETAQVHFQPDFLEMVMRDISGKKPGFGLDLGLESHPPHEVNSGPGNEANIVDYRATSRRAGTSEDVIKGVVLCNELPYISRTMPLVTPGDVPAFMGDLYGHYLCALYSRKPYSMYIMTPESAQRMIRIARLSQVGEDPSIGYLLEPNGALSYDEISLEMALLFYESGYPVYIGPMAMAGLDAPATLAGTLLMQNAYNWIGNVVAYLWNQPGVWSGSAHTMDLRSSLCSFGSPNQVLIGLAAVQLGRFYGFHVGVNSALTDACVPDFQAGFEKGSSAMAALLSGAGYGAQGIIGADQGTGFEQLVLDNEWASALNHIFSHGVEVNEETLGVEAIQRAGILGNFLSDEHTIRHMRNTYWKSTIFNYESWDTWMAKGGKDAYTRAHEEVERILRKCYPPQPVVQPEIQQAMQAVVDEAMQQPELFDTTQYRYERLE